jgi:hypothetical protein
MSVAVGTDGAVRFGLGDGLKYMANIFSWGMDGGSESLSQTNLADTHKRRTGGLKDSSGSLSFYLEFSEDSAVALSALRMLDFIVNGTGDELKAEIVLVLQRNRIAADYDVFRSSVPGVVRLSGNVLVPRVRLNCENPEKPLIAVADWEGDGPLALRWD